MCGINGFLSKKSITDAKHRIQKMNNSLAHRGPDAEGYFISPDNKLTLGQRRLSIVDLDKRSNQPFELKNKEAIIVFNGEIYNFKELRSEIDYPFCTQSDTEVLCAGLQENGIDWIKKCNGMFSFCFYDIRNNNIVLARDRFGIKPLYYYIDDNYFIFSSEIKGILNSGLVKAEFNENAIDEYLGNRYIREPYTFFKNIYQLPAGHYMSITSDFQIAINKYWDLPELFNQDITYDEEKIYNEFKEELNKSINRRIIADVTVGSYLSGGVDSSLISAIMSINSPRPINTYTIGFPELNEFQYSRMVAEMYNTKHHEIVMHKDNYFNLMEEIIKYKDAPLGVPNEIPLAQMSKELKKEITVVLSGEGADELMGGYGRIFRSPFDFKNSEKNESMDFYTYFIDKYEYVPREIRNKYLNCSHELRDEFDNKIRKMFSLYPNEENVFRFFHKYHIKGLLQRVDITTMYASVEARVPFLDHELVEFCYKKVPYNLKLKWNSSTDETMARHQNSSKYSEVLDTPKYLLKRYAKELLPSDVVTRRKVGFPVPLNNWFPDIEQMAFDKLKNCKWLKKEALFELCNDCKTNERAGQLLWMFLNIECFRELYFENEWRY